MRSLVHERAGWHTLAKVFTEQRISRPQGVAENSERGIVRQLHVECCSIKHGLVGRTIGYTRHITR